MNEVSLQDTLKQHQKPVIVEVWASWCGPCRQMAPVVERLAAEYAGRIDVVKVNAGEQHELVRQLHVSSIPAVVAYQNGQEVARRSGVQTQAMLAELFDAVASGTPPAPGRVHRTDRLLRLAASLVLLVLAWINGFSLPLLVVAAAVFFSAVHDRCPLWQAVQPRVLEAIKARKSG